MAMNSISISFNSYGLGCGNHAYRISGFRDFRCCCCCCCYYHSFQLRRHSDIKTNIKHVNEVRAKNMISVIQKGNLSCGFSKKMRTSVAVSDLVSNVESGLVCEEEEFGHHLLKYEVPPWGNLPIDQHLDMESRFVSQPSTSSKETVSGFEHRVHLLEERDETVLSARILKLSRNNKVNSALELFRSMEVSGISPDVHACNSLLSCLLRNKLLDRALKVFWYMKTKELTTGHSYSLILKAVANAHGCGLALKIFAEQEGDYRRKKDFDIVVYNTMISICAKVDNWVYIERIWRSVKENGLIGSTITYRLLICVFARCGQSELAIDAYNEMIQNEVEASEDTMHAVIGASSKEGRWEFALSVFQDMLSDGLKPNPIACNALMNTLGKAGEVKLALKVYKIMKSIGHKPDTYTWNALLGAFYNSNRHHDTLELFETISSEKDLQLNLHLYNTALMSCQKVRLWEKSLQLLWKMETSDLTVPVASYNLVIGACEVARKPKVALEVYQHMIQEKCEPDTFTHLSLIRACVWGSMWDEVEEILSRVEPNASIYNAVIQGMCLKGKYGPAKKLYMKMRKIDLKPDGKTRALMLQNLPKDN